MKSTTPNRRLRIVGPMWGVAVLILLAGPASLAAKAKAKPKAPKTGQPTTVSPPKGAKNLLENGDFDKPAKGGQGPANWAPVDNLVWHWVDAPKASDRGKVLHIDTDINQGQAFHWWIDHFVHGKPLPAAPAPKPTKPPKYATVAGLVGGFYWSDYIKVKKGGAYRVYVDAKGKPAKVFIRGFKRKRKPRFGDDQPAVLQKLDQARGKPTKDHNGRPVVHRLHYTYTSWFPVGGSDQWATYSHRQPRHPNNRQITADVQYIRIMIYPYWPPGDYWFDNVRVYEVPGKPAPPHPNASETQMNQGKVVR